jgi:hypothetical protein
MALHIAPIEKLSSELNAFFDAMDDVMTKDNRYESFGVIIYEEIANGLSMVK